MGQVIREGDTGISLSAAAATGRGSIIELQSAVENVRAYVTITNTATVKLEVSYDGSTFFDLLTGITASAIYEFAAYKYIAANVTAYTNGTVTVTFEGR